MIHSLLLWPLLGLLALAACARPADEPPLVLAAASLQESLNEAADAWAAQGHRRPTISFAASSALARQVESGAAADLFISADRDWMDHVERRQLLQPGARRDLVGNALVVVGPAGAAPLALEAAALRTRLGGSRLAMADPDNVPAGRYGRAVLTSLGLWDALADRIAAAENVRAALALVERRAAPLGIVYATDARASTGVRVVATFPPQSHQPIVYPVALLASARSPDARAFYDFLLSPEAQAIFARLGFTPAPSC